MPITPYSNITTTQQNLPSLLYLPIL